MGIPTDNLKGVLLDQFAVSGYGRLDLPIIQPADCFLDLSGEEIRRETFFFTDPHGEEKCLRPDLTIPTCRSYLPGDGGSGKLQKSSYFGKTFRCPTKGNNASEFYQAGIERIGGRNSPTADAEIFNTTKEALCAAGVKGLDVTIGDLALFSGFIDALDLPDAWRRRMQDNLSRPQDFTQLLQRFSGTRHVPSGVLRALGEASETEARAMISDLMGIADITPVGVRSVDDIADRLIEKAFDVQAKSLSRETVRLIETFLSIEGPPRRVLSRVEKLMTKHGLKLDKPLERTQRCLDLLLEDREGIGRISLACGFGRRMGYYTGFVFEIHSDHPQAEGTLAGGGRYDDLMQRLGSKKRIPAVGSMIRPDRVLSVLVHREAER